MRSVEVGARSCAGLPFLGMEQRAEDRHVRAREGENPMSLMQKTLPILVLAFPLAAAADPLPKPITDMECLVGNWKATGTLSAGKDSAKVNVTWNCKRISARFGITCAGVITGIPGLARYEETDLFGFEPNSNLYHWFSVTNAGETHDHVAPIPKGGALQFVFNGTQDGKPFKEVIDLKFAPDSRSFALRTETFSSGVSTSVLEAVAKK
jgi:hypothetical protein